MTSKTLLPILDLQKDTGITSTKFTVKVRGLDFVRAATGIPIDPNVRRPKRNKTVDSIIQSISENPFHEISSPLHITALSAEKVRRVSTAEELLELTFQSVNEEKGTAGHGLIDGGHRLEALRLALLEKLEIANVLLTLCIYVGLSDAQAKAKARELNTSQAVDKTSLLNSAGNFDGLKDELGSKYFIRYYANQPNTPNDTFCSAGSLILSFNLFHPRYNGVEPTPYRRHPIRSSRSSSPSYESYFKDAEEMMFLAKDIISIQAACCRAIEKSHINSPFPKITVPKDSRRFTHLPDPTCPILSIKIPSRGFVCPMMAAFRVWLDGERWIFPLDSFRDGLAGRLATKYKEMMNKEMRASAPIDANIRDVQIWDTLYQLSSSILNSRIKEKGGEDRGLFDA